MARELQKHQLIERSITKKYRHELWNQFVEAVKEYKLVEKDDIICVNIDGTAQSILIAKLFQHLKRISDTPFEVVFKSDIDCSYYGIPTENEPSGYNKITSNECRSDIIEHTIKNMLHNGKIESVLPMESSVIRPLFCIDRNDIAAFVRYNELDLAVTGAKDEDTASLLSQLENKNKGICHSIFRSIHALSLDTMPGYVTDGEQHSYLEKY